MKLQFSLRRLFVAITLIAIGSGAMSYFVAHFTDVPPFTALEWVSGICSCPLIGAGLFTPINRPFLGAFLGLLGFPIFMFYLACATGGMSV